MHPRVSAVFAAILMLVGILSLSFEERIDDWVKDNSIQIEKDEIELLGMQETEHWPVLIVDFDAGNSNWGSDEANDILIPRASEYVSQLSSSSTNLNIDVYSSITIPEYSMQYYGSDYGIQRDSSEDGTHLPMLLAKEVVNEQIDLVEWDKYDLDGDGWVDRLLILHTSIGQEEGGDSNRIWSHFTNFDDSISLPGDLKIAHYTMASLATGESGFGTIMHEMLHQLGAYDLYPSHGSINQHPWKGVGDWDIMANGNWNGGGKWPAIPTASTVAEIGVNTSLEIDNGWMENQNCIGPSLVLESISRGGKSLKIQVDEYEYVWIEYRDDFGFDSYLPGSGVLVTYQDLSAGNLEHNELNANPDRPYLVVIEADGNNGLRTGTSDGEQSDLFTNGTSFGNTGILIRDHDGILIPWTAEIEITDRTYVNLTSTNCEPMFTIDAPNYGASLLPNEPMEVIITSQQNCNLTIDLSSSDGRILLTNTTRINIDEVTNVEFYFSSPGSSNSESMVSGIIECGESMYDLETKILTISRRPVESSFSSEIDAYTSSKIAIPIDSEGNGMQRFSAEVDGALSRIATIESQLDLEGNDEIVVSIDPKGLLAPNMLVKGEIVIFDTSGEKWFIEVELTAQNEDSNGFQKLTTPGRAIGIASILASLWVILGIREKSSSKPEIDKISIEDNNQGTSQTSITEYELDVWGRPLD
uniref:Peptidase M6-like domain-containing protein n=1 Tax=uncultured Poseidoniia archaeon TaxID=1697135 RepID=A0A1B1TDK4_9ARCH|nr:hypothetical protein [uncultured Candidatus Thalassoarchaea sp.]